jgi:Xaa-Pro dipeptidase
VAGAEAPLTRARDAMAAAGVDAVLAGSPGLVAFLTGHVVPAFLAYPSRDGRLEKPAVALVTRDGAVTVAATPAPAVGDAIAYGDGGRGLRDGPDAFAAIAQGAAELGLRSGRVAVELAHVSAGAVAALTAGAPDLRLEPLDGLLLQAKAIKSDAEVEGLKLALDLCDAGQQAVRDAIRPGLSELELYAAAVLAMNRRTESLVISLCELQVGVRGEQMAGSPTDARVADGELVMCDLAPRHPNGWWGDSCMTAACGEPDPEAVAAWRALSDGIEAGREVLRPGVRAGDVYAKIAEYAGDFPGYAGHSIGRDHFEEPVIAPGNPEPLAEGSVMVLEPGRYGDGRGMRIEHAFRVTPDGGQRLSTFSLEL